MLFVGLMSGTSCDGIDVALVEFKADTPLITKILATVTVPFPAATRSQLLTLIADLPLPVSVISQLDAQLGHLYADAVKQLLIENSVAREDIEAIGIHGQTIHHQPPDAGGAKTNGLTNTIQLGSAAITAQLTGIKTVANFRQMDVAHGGQGAPLAPVLHQHLFNQENQTTAVLNLGGIANITLLKGDAVIGFDTGPASCLMDVYIQSQRGKPYDESGQWAKQGQVNADLLSALMADGYFIQTFPKSTGREYFNLSWLKQHLAAHQITAVDVQRTLLQLTVESIALGVEQTHSEVNQMVVCGGGVHNTFLMQQLDKRFNFKVMSSQAYGYDPDHIEAVLMAWLARQNVAGNKLDLSQITGCQVPHVYGVQYQPT